MRELSTVVFVALLSLGAARADEAADFCRLRNEAVPDEDRDEADERCNRVAAAMVGSPGAAALAQLTELDEWLARHRRPAVTEPSSCDEMVEARRRALHRVVDERLSAEDRLLRDLERTRKKPRAQPKRRRVRDLENVF